MEKPHPSLPQTKELRTVSDCRQTQVAYWVRRWGWLTFAVFGKGRNSWRSHRDFRFAVAQPNRKHPDAMLETRPFFGHTRDNC